MLLKRHIINWAIIMVSTWHVFAFENNNSFQIHGFASQGFLATTQYNYLISTSTNGSFDFNEVALNASSTPIDRLRIGVQLFARDMGSEGNHEVSIDWAYGDYRYQDWLGIQIGRFKTPMMLFNQTRDIDIARTCILLPQGMYNEDYRENSLATDGIDLYGNVVVKEFGNIDYDLFGGGINLVNVNARFNRDRNFVGGSQMAINMAINMKQAIVSQLPPIIDPNSIIASVNYLNTTDETSHFKYSGGARLKWNITPINFNLGGSLVTRVLEQKKTDNFASTIIFPPMEPMPADTINSTMNIKSTSEITMWDRNLFFEWTWQDLELVGEIGFPTLSFDIESEFNGSSQKIDIPDNTPVNYYGMITYSFFDWFTAGLYYSSIHIDKNDLDGSKAVKNDPTQNFKDYMTWQKDIALSFKFDISPFWIVKAEGHYINGTANVLKIDNMANSFENDTWFAGALKSTFSF